MAIKNVYTSISAAAVQSGGFREKYPHGGAFLTPFKTSHNESKTDPQRRQVR